MAQDYLRLLEAVLGQSAQQDKTPYLGPGNPGYVSGNIASKLPEFDYTTPTYEAPTTESDGFQLTDLNPLPMMGHVASGAIDILSRPSYAMNNFYENSIRNIKEAYHEQDDEEGAMSIGDWLQGYAEAATESVKEEPGQLWQGLSGDQKVMGGQVLEGIPGYEDLPGPAKFLTGLGVDIFGDPTTYVGGAGLAKLLRLGKAKDAWKAANAADDVLTEGGEHLDDVVDLAEDTTTTVEKRPDLSAEPSQASKIDDKSAGAPTLIHPPETVAQTVDALPPEFVATPQMIEQTQRLNLPIPLGNRMDVSAGRTAIGALGSRVTQTRGAPGMSAMHDYAEGTDLISVPGESAYRRVDDMSVSAVDYIDNTEDITDINTLKRLEDEGRISTLVDSPAQAEFVHQLQKYDPANAESRPIPGQRFSDYDAATRRDITTAPSKARGAADNPQIRVQLKLSGKNTKTVTLPSHKVWDLMRGKAVQFSHTRKGGSQMLTPETVMIKRAGSTKYTSIKQLVDEDNAARSSQKYWDDATKEANDVINNPHIAAERLVNVRLNLIEHEADRAAKSFKSWVKQVRKAHPQQFSEATLKKVYDEGQAFLKELWHGRADANADPMTFLRNKETITEVQEVMASAIARHASPDELVTDIARIKRKFANRKAAELLQLARTSANASPEYAEKVAEQADEILQDANRTVEAAETAEAGARAERVVNAQKTGDPTEVRKADVTNEINDDVTAILKAGGGSDRWVDSATGMVKSIVNNTMESIMAGLGKSDIVKGKRYPYFNQMKQTKAVVAAKHMVDNYAHGKLPPDLFLARTVQVLRAVEHQMTREGFFPLVWNGVANKAGKKHIDFSAADLLDDMLKVDPALARAALNEKSFNDVLQAAVLKDRKFKGESSLDKIEDDALRDFLRDYDAVANTKRAQAPHKVADMKAVESAAKFTSEHQKEVVGLDSSGRAAAEAAEAGNRAKTAVTNSPGTPVETLPAVDTVAKDTANQVQDTVEGVSKADRAVESQKNALVSGNQAKSNRASQNVMKASGSKPAKGGQTVSVDEMEKSWLTRFGQLFSNHVGAGLVRPMMETKFNFVSQYISRAARDWESLPKKFSPEAMGAALKHMGSGDLSHLSEEALEAHRYVRQRMEDIFGGSGIEKFVKGNSTITKAGIPATKLNKWMRSKGARGADGKVFQFGKYTEGEIQPGTTEWLKEWEQEVVKFENPDEAIQFLHNLENAAYSSVIERMLYDDLVARFSHMGKGYTTSHEYLEGVSLSKEHALEAKRLGELIEELQHPKSAGQILSTYDQGLRLWKTGVTQYNIPHHVKNYSGDSFLHFSDGGKIRHQFKAAKILNKFRESKFDPNLGESGLDVGKGMSLKEFGDIDKLKETILRPAKEGEAAIVNKQLGLKLDWAQAYAAMTDRGLLLGAGAIEDILRAGKNPIAELGRKYPKLAAPLGGRGHKVVTQASEGREHLVRAAHFIHAFESSAVKRLPHMTDADFLQAVIDDAARRVRKWHPDGTDLTAAERKYGRRLIPFYSWQRKSIPLLLESAVRRPGLTLYYPKAEQNLSMAMGNLEPGEERNPYNPMFPGSELLPDFLSGSPAAIINRDEEGMTLAQGPSTPPLDFLELLNNPGGSAKGMLTPAIATPLAFMAGEDPRTGLGFQGAGDYAEYAGEQIPGVGTGVRWGTSKQPMSNSLKNWLLAAGVVDTAPYTQTALTDLRERLKEESGG